MKKRYILAGLGSLLMLSLVLALSISSVSPQRGQAAVIDLSGQISPSSSAFSQSITPERVRDLNSQAENRGMDAIVYEINSGGGAVVASKEVMREIESVDMPTVCRMRDTSASGAYLLATACDHVVADSASLTGSIGVRSSYLEFSGTLDKLGIRYVNISSGERKELGSPYQNATEEEKQILQEKTEIIHEDFLSTVEEERNLTSEQLETVRTGEPFLGSEAHELDLVDSLGGREEAFSKAENLTAKDLRFVRIEQETGFSLFSLFGSGADSNIMSTESVFQSDIL